MFLKVSPNSQETLREKCPNTELFLVRIFLYSDYEVNLRIQSEYREIRTRNNSVFGQFSRSENNCIGAFVLSKLQTETSNFIKKILAAVSLLILRIFYNQVF